MKLGARGLGAIAGALLFVMPVSALGQTTTKIEELKPGGEVEPQPDGLLHKASGYHFSAKLGEVPARKTTTYGPGDADVYYTLHGGGNGDGWINLYVYPATITLTDEVANVSQSIIEGTSGHRIAPKPGMGRAPAGIEEGWFEGSIQGTNIITGYRIARVGSWFIKARVSISAGADAATFQRLADALGAIEFSPRSLISHDAVRMQEPAA